MRPLKCCSVLALSMLLSTLSGSSFRSYKGQQKAPSQRCAPKMKSLLNVTGHLE